MILGDSSVNGTMREGRQLTDKTARQLKTKRSVALSSQLSTHPFPSRSKLLIQFCKCNFLHFSALFCQEKVGTSPEVV